MIVERDIRQSVRYVRGELQRLIASETSSFRARLFEQELTRLEELVRVYLQRPTPFCRTGLAEVMGTVALYTIEELDILADDSSVVTFNQAETMKRLNLVLRSVRVLQK